MFETTKNRKDLELMATQLEHYGWATLAPFLDADDFVLEDDLFPVLTDDDEDSVPKRNS